MKFIFEEKRTIASIVYQIGLCRHPYEERHLGYIWLSHFALGIEMANIFLSLTRRLEIKNKKKKPAEAGFRLIS